jgi:hypothetical protein
MPRCFLPVPAASQAMCCSGRGAADACAARSCKTVRAFSMNDVQLKVAAMLDAAPTAAIAVAAAAAANVIPVL